MARGVDDALACAAVEQWLLANIPSLRAPLQFELITAGGSNLTFRVADAAGHRMALRRPPLRGQIESAHDMQREWRILKGLADTAVPVPAALAYCDDSGVTGAEFYAMSFIDGRILRSPADAAVLGPDEKARATESLIDVQVRLHQFDFDGAGLGDLGRRDNYLARQVTRWRKQVAAAPVRELPPLQQMADYFLENLPDDFGRVSLVHGDYRFDNTVLDHNAEVCAVLDWELCTLGDPVADFFWSSMYWGRPGDNPPFIRDMPTEAEGFCSRDQLIAMYAARTGFDLSARAWYEAFCWWKMACIVEGVHARLRKGGSGGRGAASAELVAAMVDDFLAEASRRVDSLGSNA